MNKISLIRYCDLSPWLPVNTTCRKSDDLKCLACFLCTWDIETRCSCHLHRVISTWLITGLISVCLWQWLKQRFLSLLNTAKMLLQLSFSLHRQLWGVGFLCLFGFFPFLERIICLYTWKTGSFSSCYSLIHITSKNFKILIEILCQIILQNKKLKKIWNKDRLLWKAMRYNSIEE